ncbi:N-terminal domain of NEFA-interacting nuclear protein NIP30-domain-containing protein, partial [Chaetomidium leptoderma]
MSSRFVSAGAIDATTGEAAATTTTAPTPSTTTSSTATTATTATTAKQAEWAAVTAQLETDRRLRDEARRQREQGGTEEKSLYDTLQANKAAKQAAFDEAHRLRNQFRALDDDEVDFLEEVREKKRREEAEARREVERGLEEFRRRAAGVF